MSKRPRAAAGVIGVDAARRGRDDYSSSSPSLFTRAVTSVFAFVRFAEFEILFLLFFFVAFLVFKDLTSRPEYNDVFVKKQGAYDWWLH